MDDLVIVDSQYDFIDGSLACAHAKEAVAFLVSFANAHDVRVLYTSDWHNPTNGSFTGNGGIWPVHCVAGTHGAALSEEFSKIVKEENRPQPGNIFLKGRADDVEEYSAFAGKTEKGLALSETVSSHVYVGGIASEYCVRETVLSLLAAGHSVTLLTEGLGWVAEADHKKSVADLAQRGAEIL